MVALSQDAVAENRHPSRPALALRENACDGTSAVRLRAPGSRPADYRPLVPRSGHFIVRSAHTHPPATPRRINFVLRPSMKVIPISPIPNLGVEDGNSKPLGTAWAFQRDTIETLPSFKATPAKPLGYVRSRSCSRRHCALVPDRVRSGDNSVEHGRRRRFSDPQSRNVCCT